MSVPIIIDDREKKPYDFSEVGINTTVTDRLDVGDYTMEGFRDVFAVERKTLNDLASSVGSERDRFQNEIRRAQQLQEFVVVIEADREQVEKYSGTKNCPNYYSNIYPNSVLGTVDKWPQSYDTLEFVWAGNRYQGMQETLYHLDKWMVNYSP